MNLSTIESARAVPERTHAPRWASLLGTFLGIGNLRPGPGTWASLATLALWTAGARFIGESWRAPAAAVIAGGVLAAGIPAATRVAQEKGDEDPSCVVIDEVAGQMLAFTGVPLHWKPLLAAFILFRGFDILKPPPVRHLENIRGGAGIMLDDIGAGLYALVAVQLLLHFGVLK